MKITDSGLPIQFEPAGVSFVRNRIGSTDKAVSEIGFEAKMDLEIGLQSLVNLRRGHMSEVRDRQRRGGKASLERIQIAAPFLGDEEWQAYGARSIVDG